jgi:hypothetical protein
MRVPLLARRPPSTLEQLVGPTRARMLRRRLGLVAIGTGIALLRPRPRWRGTHRAVAAAGLLTVLVALAVLV